MSGFFITGTDTGVGKTFVSCLWASRLSLRKRVGVMKPFASGSRLDALRLRRCAHRFDLSLDEINPVFFDQPLSPYSADGFPEQNDFFQTILKNFRKVRDTSDVVIVEGMGGLHVPITRSRMVADLAREMDLPLVIVTHAGLGTLNHTLLTVHYAVQKGLKIAGLIMNNVRKTSDLSSQTNLDALGCLTGLPILGFIPYLRGRFEEKLKMALKKGFINLPK